jgi:hypothetical protein
MHVPQPGDQVLTPRVDDLRVPRNSHASGLPRRRDAVPGGDWGHYTPFTEIAKIAGMPVAGKIGSDSAFHGGG